MDYEEEDWPVRSSCGDQIIKVAYQPGLRTAKPREHLDIHNIHFSPNYTPSSGQAKKKKKKSRNHALKHRTSAEKHASRVIRQGKGALIQGAAGSPVPPRVSQVMTRESLDPLTLQ